MVYSWYQLFWLFLIYSFAGWCAGVIANAVKRHQFVNTGFLNLPLCPLYGVGAVLYAIFLSELKEQWFFLFLGGMILAAFLSLVAGIFMEHIFHRKWWDYSKNRFQFEGYISLWHLIAWGALAVITVVFFNDLLLGIVAFVPVLPGKILLAVLGGLTILDIICSLAAVLQMRHRLRRLEGISQSMQELSDSLGNAITRRIQRRIEKAYPNISLDRLLEPGGRGKEKGTGVFAEGCCFYKLVWLFLLGALLGDLIEMVFCRFTMGWWMSRSSVIYGPFSIVWGLGCVMLTAFLYKYKDSRDRHIFIAGTVLGGAYEYICSVFTELVFGTIFWDYSKIPFNLGGRINLLYCFFWGIVAIIWLKGIYPLLSAWIEKIPKKAGGILTWVLIVLMTANMAVSAMALYRYSSRQLGEPAATELGVWLDTQYPDERMDRIYPKAKVVK